MSKSTIWETISHQVRRKRHWTRIRENFLFHHCKPVQQVVHRAFQIKRLIFLYHSGSNIKRNVLIPLPKKMVGSLAGPVNKLVVLKGMGTLELAIHFGSGIFGIYSDMDVDPLLTVGTARRVPRVNNTD